MLRMAVLGSGSAGNSILVEAGDTRLLVDAGLSAKQLAIRLCELGVAPESLSGILLTHEHGDHARGLEVFLRKRTVPVYANARTREALTHKIQSSIAWRVFDSGNAFSLNDITVESFSIPHDAADPVGFVIRRGKGSVAIATDLGFVTGPVRQSLKGVDAFFVECNYDQEMLDADLKRPWATKQRISSRHGHLSNDQVEDLLKDVATDDLKHVVFGHLSSDCNCPELVKKRMGQVLQSQGYSKVEITCAPQEKVTPWLLVREREAVWASVKGGEQGELFL